LAGALLGGNLAVGNRFVFHLLHPRLALLEPRGFLLVQRAGFLSLLDAAFLISFALVDSRRAAGLAKGGRSQHGGDGKRDELHFHGGYSLMG
jgi:hypothetical protein